MTYVLIELAFGVIGLLVGRFAVVALPVIVWTIWGVGNAEHWWGNGGEAIFLGTVFLIALGLIAALAGVLLHRALQGLRAMRARETDVTVG
jgi:hypothetical protein